MSSTNWRALDRRRGIPLAFAVVTALAFMTLSGPPRTRDLELRLGRRRFHPLHYGRNGHLSNRAADEGSQVLSLPLAFPPLSFLPPDRNKTPATETMSEKDTKSEVK